MKIFKIIAENHSAQRLGHGLKRFNTAEIGKTELKPSSDTKFLGMTIGLTTFTTMK